ncbi:putative phage tail assembly chaperone [Marinomonas arenicola]|uniref:putative phage tail assembly chaperone n=1 Tax=Marinomonas arenicola TaxID=569601 RepID=UPI00311D377F
MAQVILITVGAAAFEFTVTDKDYNKFVDSISGGKSVLPAYNLLSATVKNEQHAKLKGLVTDGENNPKASLVMEIVQIITEEFTSDLPAVVKTPTSSATSSKETDMSNS